MITEINKFGEFKHKVKPMDHQAQWLEHSWKMPAFALFWEMGCAKTKVMLDTAAKLFLAGEIDGVLVLSDNGAYRNWADYELPIHMMDGIPVRVGCYASTMKAKERHAVNQLLVAQDDVLDFLVMNIEGFAGDKAPIFAEAFLESHYCLWIIDESTSIKTITAKRTQKILELKDKAPYRRILTGTPVTNGPMDLFAQFAFLGDNLLGHQSFVSFQAEYAIRILATGHGMRGHYQTIGYKGLDKLSKIIKPCSSRLLKTDCLNLPDKLYKVRYVEHTPEQSKIYNEIKSIAVAEVDRGLVTVTSALSTLGKLHQINCGHIMRDDGTKANIPSNRTKEMIQLLKQIHEGGKCIIWACFVRDIELICAALTEEYGKDSWVTYTGATPQHERPKNIDRWRTTTACRWFVSNQATGGKGITLIEASHAVYYSNTFSLEDRLQSEDRNHRKGQTSACTIVDLVTQGTVDVKIVKALKEKKDLASEILDSYQELLMAY